MLGPVGDLLGDSPLQHDILLLAIVLLDALVHLVAEHVVALVGVDVGHALVKEGEELQSFGQSGLIQTRTRTRASRDMDIITVLVFSGDLGVMMAVRSIVDAMVSVKFQ